MLTPFLRTLEERVETVALERPVGQMLDQHTVMAQAVAAVVTYRGLAQLEEDRQRIEAEPALEPREEIDHETLVSDSEWAILRPLFLLYIERETALMLEASRGLGVDVFGRTASEIASDITAFEQELPRKAFLQPALTV